MHLAADRAAVRARLDVRRQQAGLGLDLVQVLADRQRVPDLDAAVLQRGHQHRGRQQQHLGLHRRVVGRDHLLGEIQPREPAHQPAAQRPGAVVLAADRENGLWPWGRSSAAGIGKAACARPVPERCTRRRRWPPWPATCLQACTCCTRPTKPTPTCSRHRGSRRSSSASAAVAAERGSQRRPAHGRGAWRSSRACGSRTRARPTASTA